MLIFKQFVAIFDNVLDAICEWFFPLEDIEDDWYDESDDYMLD